MIRTLTWVLAGLALTVSAILLALALGRADDRPDQITPGRTLYDANCAPCHEVGGRIGPELSPAVLAGYGNAHALFTYTRFAMPYDDPGALTDQEYWRITAYMLHTAELLPDGTHLDPETAPDVTF